MFLANRLFVFSWILKDPLGHLNGHHLFFPSENRNSIGIHFCFLVRLFVYSLLFIWYLYGIQAGSFFFLFWFVVKFSKKLFGNSTLKPYRLFKILSRILAKFSPVVSFGEILPDLFPLLFLIYSSKENFNQSRVDAWFSFEIFRFSRILWIL